MAYEIPFTDNANKGTITVEDSSINTDTSLQLVGRNLSGFGSSLNTNFLQMLENFANANPPTNPVEGQLWYDTTAGIDQLKIYDGTQWVAAGGLKKSASQPAVDNSVAGDIWVDTTNSQLYIYTGSGYVLVGPEYSSASITGAISVDIDRADDAPKEKVTIIYAQDIPMAIISNVAFAPKTNIAGYTSTIPIQIGINLNKTLSSQLNGTAEKANNLVINNLPVDGTKFVRNDAEAGLQTVNVPLKISDARGIEFGQTKNIAILVEDSDSIIEHSGTGTLDVRTTATQTPAIRVKTASVTNSVGINNPTPAESLDVTGNILASGTIKTSLTTNSTSSTTGSITTPGGLGVAQDLHVGGTLTVNSQITAENIIPENNGTHNIGTASLFYDNLYANRITTTSIQPKAGSSLAITATLTGTATSAGKLNSATTFRLDGDVTADSFTFDGQTGGTTKTLANSTISPAFITNKPSIPAPIVGTDELLVTRGSTIYKASQSDIVGSIQTIPVGTVVPFAGTTAPSGWLLCDGSSQLRTTYSTLFTSIGTTYGADTSQTFNLPDLRGRGVVGALGSPSSNNNRITAGTGTLGGISGNATNTITAANLPDHEHDLKSDTNDQFYVTSTVGGLSGTNTSAGGAASDGASGSKMSTSGGLTTATNSALDTTDPFVTLNYIIYTGVIV
tara:strand:+ start:31074 stop:33101 length:2028 start_codon:yes stop_codon:yes gene_type:complete